LEQESIILQSEVQVCQSPSLSILFSDKQKPAINVYSSSTEREFTC